MQQPMPNNDTGVPVNLSVLDSNGNFRTIGTTITNGLGDYHTHGLLTYPETSLYTQLSQAHNHTMHLLHP